MQATSMQRTLLAASTCASCVCSVAVRLLFRVLQSQERDMVTVFKQRGWDAFMLHPTFEALKAGKLALRHGMVVMQRYRELKTSWP